MQKLAHAIYRGFFSVAKKKKKKKKNYFIFMLKSMFWIRIKTPANPQFFFLCVCVCVCVLYLKVGFKGVYISRTCFPDMKRRGEVGSNGRLHSINAIG